ncbi:hypothetical protein C8J57DRAFT_1354770 [Mycena rebaudengoi]|nr:hypothetical protein C8J57DRAFT_1354770 [Mycena rebaudengoi]
MSYRTGSRFSAWEAAAPAPRELGADEAADALRLWVCAFNVVTTFGFCLLAVIFLTAVLASSVKRISTWYGYILAWMAFCITPFLVFGHQTYLDTPPSFHVCLVDSAIMYASRPLAAFSTLALVVHLYLNISAQLKHKARPNSVSCLLIIPPITHLGMFLWTLILGLRNPDLVELEPGGFYCHLTNSLPGIVGAALVGFATFLVLLFQAVMAMMLYRNWRAFRELPTSENHEISLSILIRVSAFGTLPIIALVLICVSYVPDPPEIIYPIYNLLLAFMPTSAALIFGSQMDLINIWMFWRQSSKLGHSLKPIASLDSDTSFS